MASSGKKKTTMAKLNREHRLRERRAEKKARKDARKRASEDHPGALSDETLTSDDELTEPGDGDGAGSGSEDATPASAQL